MSSCIGIILGIVITSQPYIYLLDRLGLSDYSFWECGLCLGTWTAFLTCLLWITQELQVEPNMLCLALIPLVAEKTVRWIIKI